jgi:hypothetical protein
VRTFVLPRSSNNKYTALVFLSVRRLFGLRLKRARSYEQRDAIMAMYAPVSLLCLPVAWLTTVLLGYVLMFHALGVDSWHTDFKMSGSSLLTLGFSTVDGVPRSALAFSEAAIGLILVALLISYLPTIYSAFSRRETAVTLLEVRAGSPPSALEMIARYHRIHGLDELKTVWSGWEVWFADIEESHTSLAVLTFFRSPLANRSWVTAAGTILDTAALTSSTLDLPKDPHADLCIRAGYLSLRHIADFFRISYNPNPHWPDDKISITREEFDAAYDRMAAQGIPLKPDRDKAWADFAGWRVNYDTVLLALATLTMAPYAPWSSDRAPQQGHFSTGLAVAGGVSGAPGTIGTPSPQVGTESKAEG